MRIRTRLTFAVVFAAVLTTVFVLPATSAGATATGAPAAARPADHEPPGTQQYYWRWSDGSEEKRRTFRQSRYRVPEELPQLVVSAYPSRPSALVRLTFLRGGRWLVEDSGRLSSAGSVRLALNPYCPDGRWCDGTFTYRALVNGKRQTLYVTFAP